MICAPLRPDEAGSLAALRALDVLDTEREAPFDALVQAAAAVCGAPISLISLIDGGRQWFKANQGLPGVTETPRDLAFCAHAVLGDGLFEVPDALRDERFFDNPLVTAAPNIRFYAGIPVLAGNGMAVGTLCVIDQAPRQLDDRQRDVLRQLALAASQMLQGRAALRRERMAHKDLAARMEGLRLLVDAVPSMLCYLNSDLTYRFANRAYGQWFGADVDTLAGRHISELLGPKLYEANRPRLEAALRGEPQVFQRVVPGPGGRTRHSLAHYLPDVVDGVVVGLLIEVNDVTPLKESELALRVEAVERERVHRRLERSNQALHDAQRVGGIGSWTWGVGERHIKGSAVLDSILGRERGAGPPTLAEHLQVYTPESRARVQQAVDRSIAHGEGFALELDFVRPDGTRGWCESRAEVVVDAQGRVVRMHGTLQDITKRKLAELEAQRAHQVLRAAIEALDEPFVVYDPDDRLVICNERYRVLYATSRDLLVPGARFEDIIREGARRGQYKAALGRCEEWVAERMAAHRSGYCRLVQELDDGRTLRVVECRMPDGHLVGFRVDITDLVRAAEAAEEASRAKSDFIATVSHELRTPLQSINGYAELGQHIAQHEGQDRFASMFGVVLGAGHRMLSLVNDLLDLSAIDAATLAVTRRPEDLRALAAQVCDELAPLVQARGIRLEQAPAMPALPVDADAGRLQQVIRNVLANAIRFSPAGTVVLVDGADLGSQGIELTVRDQGPGIPPDELELVFDAFVQSSRTRDGSGGSGLGLAICRRIMTAHAGTITAENAPQAGALLRLRLPAARRRPDPASALAQPAHAAHAAHMVHTAHTAHPAHLAGARAASDPMSTAASNTHGPTP